MSVLLATMLGTTGAGVGLAAVLARYAQRNWTRRAVTVTDATD